MRKIYIFLLLFSLLPVSLLGQSYLKQPKVKQSLNYSSPALNIQAAKFKQILYVLGNAYVDTINIEKLSEEVMIAAMQELDPHSSYISAKDVKEMEEPLIGKFEGIGIEYAIIRDTLTVQSVIPGGPSEKVGLRAGDKINRVDDKVVSGTGLTQTKVLKLLRGDKGTKVKVGIIRRGVKGETELVITRDKIPLNTVTSAYQIADGIMYVRVSNFGAETYEEIMNPVLGGSVKNGLILDLRGNGGGYLSAALRIVNEFLEKDQLILYPFRLPDHPFC